VSGGEVSAFYIARTLPQKLNYFPLISINSLRLYTYNPTIFRCLTIFRYCQPAWGHFLVGGRPLPLYSGTCPHTSTIASSYPPHPSETNGGGQSGCPRLFSCSKASMAASARSLLSRAPLASASGSPSVYSARTLLEWRSLGIPLFAFVPYVSPAAHQPELRSPRSWPTTPLLLGLVSVRRLRVASSRSCPP
jgi:hypothetical protein